jgi:hypothetical protein
LQCHFLCKAKDVTQAATLRNEHGLTNWQRFKEEIVMDPTNQFHIAILRRNVEGG